MHYFSSIFNIKPGHVFLLSIFYEVLLHLLQGDMGTLWSLMTDICMSLEVLQIPLFPMTYTVLIWILKYGQLSYRLQSLMCHLEDYSTLQL
uniref:Putative product n=1 Tax=Xenopsylla cheopis TaxID=163159 RepID=A0A6M2E0V9_XENCH